MDVAVLAIIAAVLMLPAALGARRRSVRVVALLAVGVWVAVALVAAQ